jgi:acetolactate synthase regulatory subunit
MNAQLQPSGSAYFLDTAKPAIETHTLAVIVDNEPGVLARVIGLFAGRGYNIESLTVSETQHEKHISRITVVTSGTPSVIEQIKNQLARLVPVHSVADLCRLQSRAGGRPYDARQNSQQRPRVRAHAHHVPGARVWFAANRQQGVHNYF